MDDEPCRTVSLSWIQALLRYLPVRLKVLVWFWNTGTTVRGLLLTPSGQQLIDGRRRVDSRLELLHGFPSVRLHLLSLGFVIICLKAS